MQGGFLTHLCNSEFSEDTVALRAGKDGPEQAPDSVRQLMVLPAVTVSGILTSLLPQPFHHLCN